MFTGVKIMKREHEKFFNAYLSNFETHINLVSMDILDSAIRAIEECILAGKRIYICGNGGSAAIADHFVCDFMKGLGTDTGLRVKINCLNSNISIYSAISNDIEFEEVFSYQINAMAEANDLLITVSSSGNSENIIRALVKANEINMRTIALSGFDGGRSKCSDIHINVPATNYGVVEDSHHFLLHMIVQFLRTKYTQDEKNLIL